MDRDEDDRSWMARAIALAERSRDVAPPNPFVGCVLVRDGRELAVGWTRAPGDRHAEVVALDAAGDARGATAYVTLEPCAHHGRTPPCADALVSAGVARVVVGTPDPNPVAAGGVEHLRGAGIVVEEQVLEPWVRRQLAAFLTTATRGRPHVVLKLAQTLDGELHAPAGRWVTGPASRRAVHRMRAGVDAVLVGSGTVLADDPRLDVRDAPLRGAQPRPVVLDGRGRTPPDARVVRPGAVVVTADGPPAWREALQEAGASVLVVPRGPAGGVDLPAALAALWEQEGIARVLAEPGETLAGALVADGLVDRVVRHVATSVRAADGRARIVGAVAPTATWPLARRRVRGDDLEVIVDRPVDG